MERLQVSAASYILYEITLWTGTDGYFLLRKDKSIIQSYIMGKFTEHMTISRNSNQGVKKDMCLDDLS
jgi:hypothetical protein